MALRRRAGVTYEPSGDATVILDADGTVMTTLNPIGSVIWRALDGQRDAAALARDLVAGFNGVAVDELEADIRDFVATLAASDLIDID